LPTFNSRPGCHHEGKSVKNIMTPLTEISGTAGAVAEQPVFQARTEKKGIAHKPVEQ